ncbi:MAG: flagellar biosynthesis protein FlhA [Gammaproteobacteria bacterium]|nr:MAG: flagellar biosynthesis protein FlhA [Gammaproteobacteria bacterium]
MSNTAAEAASNNGFSLTGLGTPVLLFMMLIMVVMPLPPLALDIFFTFNIALAIIVLLVSIYAQRPLDFGVFPTVLLIATLLRLALNVASTRVVLMKGHDGTDAAQEIASEADFYGAMDGASKFVRGDAVAGILILFINIIGGFAVGVLQHNLSAGEAAHNYVLLTIGDGLVAQIPSLLLSTATAIIVTRVSGSQDVGNAVGEQLLSNPKVLAITAALIGIMGLVPGMPNLVFLSLAALLGSMAYLKSQPEKTTVEEAPAETSAPLPVENKELSWDDVSSVDEIGLEVGYRLISMVDRNQGGELLPRIKGIRKKLSQELGFLVHAVHIRDNLNLSPNEYRITFHDVTVGQGEIHPGRDLAINPGQVYGELDGIATKDPTFGLDATWIDNSQRDDAQAKGYTVVDCPTVIATHLSQLIKNHAHELIGQDGVQQLLDKLAQSSPKLVENLVPNVLSLGDITKVMQNLLEDGVPIRDVRSIAEALAESGGKGQDTDTLTSRVRMALGGTIFQTINGIENEMAVIVLDSQLEQILQGATQGNIGGMEPTLIENMINQLRQASAQLEAEGKTPVLLVASHIRLFLSRLLKSRMDNFYILAYEEIPASKNIKVVATVGNQAA